MGKIIAIANHKGGVGKTTTVMNLGAILSRMGKKVLLVDLDAQANLTSSMLREEQEVSIYHALKGQEPLPIKQITETLSVVPSSIELATVELEISSRMSREYILRNILQPVAESYDYILLDCAPSLGLLTINALTASQGLYIPLTAEALPTKGLKMLLDMVEQVKTINKELNLEGILITRWERSKLSSMVEETLRATYKDVVLTTKIRKNVAIAEAPLYAQDILTYAPDSNGANDYRELAEEVIKRNK